MPQLLKDFTEHPHAVGETYTQHWFSAMTFAVTLIVSALACALHAFVPGLCKTTASRTVATLHQRMVTNRQRHGTPAREAAQQRAA